MLQVDPFLLISIIAFSKVSRLPRSSCTEVGIFAAAFTVPEDSSYIVPVSAWVTGLISEWEGHSPFRILSQSFENCRFGSFDLVSESKNSWKIVDCSQTQNNKRFIEEKTQCDVNYLVSRSQNQDSLPRVKESKSRQFTSCQGVKIKTVYLVSRSQSQDSLPRFKLSKSNT